MALSPTWTLIAAVAAAGVLLPAGTVINVRLTEAIDVDLSRAGETFTARVDDPVTRDGLLVVPREARAVVQAVKVVQSGAIAGRDAISLKLNSVSFGGKVHEIVTEYATVQGEGEGKRSARKIGGSAGLGAIFGGIAGGGEGALIGTAVAAAAEEHLRLAAETRVQFRLASSVRIQP